jgi:DNA-directed RNA polymerase specialized sigma24 family protein
MDKELNQEPFNLFLSWLSPDPDAAGKKYEDMRRRLIIMLECRACVRAEEIADEAFDRFVRRLPELRQQYHGDPLPYLCVIARNVHLEDLRKQHLPLPDDLNKVPAEEKETDELGELMHECLDRCMNEFDSKSRKLLLEYYGQEQQAKINFRKTLAKSMGIAANALRLRIHRLRGALETCMNECLGAKALSEMKWTRNAYKNGGVRTPSRSNV